MPVVEVLLWDGRSREQKKRIAQRITAAFVDEGVPAEAVHVIFVNVKKEDWCIGSKMCDE